MAEDTALPAPEIHEAMQAARSPRPTPGAILEVLPDGRGTAAALVIQDVFGGGLLKSSLGDGEWRFYNQIEGTPYDFAADHFDEPVEAQSVAATRDEAFAACDFGTYRVLSQRFADEWDLVENEDGRWQSCSSD